MRKLILLTLMMLFFTSIIISAEEAPKKTATISIQDVNGRYVDLSGAEVFLKNNDINVTWDSRGKSGWDPEKTNFEFTSEGLKITTVTDEALNIIIYLDNGEGYYITKQLDFSKLNNVSLNLKAKELKYLNLCVSYIKNMSIGYDLIIPERYDRKEGVYTLDTNHTKRFYTNFDGIGFVFNAYDNGYYHLYKEMITTTGNMTKTVVMPKTDKYKQCISYSSYYNKFDYLKLQLWGDPTGNWFELHNSPITLYSNVPLEGLSSIWFSSEKGNIYDVSRGITINRTDMTIGNSFKLSDLELQMNYDGSKSMHLSVDDEYNNRIRFIDMNRNNDYKYAFYTTDGNLVTSGFGSLYWNELDNKITLGKYMFKVQLNKEIMGTESTRYFLLEIMSDKKWKITDEEGNYKLVENGSWAGQTGKTTKPNFNLISDSKINISNVPNPTTDTYSGVGSTQTSSGKISDIKSTDWFYNDVTYLIEKKVINGFADNTFRPGDQVKVDAFIKMVIAALGYNLPNGAYYWAQPYIDKAIDLGIISSEDFDSYQRSITRGEMARIAAMIMNQIEIPKPYQYYEYEIMDYDAISQSLKKPVLIAMSQGIITGYEDYTFRASNLATRAQAATIISRIIDVNKRKQINYFEDQKKKLEETAITLEDRMGDHKKNIDEAIDYLLGYEYDFDPIESKEELKAVFIQKLYAFEAKLEKQIPIVYGEKKTLTIDLEGKSCDLKITENYFRATWVLSGTLSLFYEKNSDGSGFFMRDTLKNLDIGFFYYAQKDELRIDSTLPDTMIGEGYYVYKFKDEYLSRIDEFDAKDLIRSTIYFAGCTLNYDQNIDFEAYEYSDGFRQIYLYEDMYNGNGIGYMKSDDESFYIGEVNAFQFDGIGYEINSDGTAFIGEFENMILDGKGTMFCTSGLILEDTFQENVAFSRLDSHYYSINPEAPSIEAEIDKIILSQIKPNMSTSEKIKAIHDYLVLNITYDTVNVDDPLDYYNINNAYAGIVYKSTICLGYAQAMNLILNRLGIESYVVIGDSDLDGTSDHAWNYVRFPDGFFHVDVTWDDSDVGNEIYYDYFKVQDNVMRMKRSVEDILGFEQ